MPKPTRSTRSHRGEPTNVPRAPMPKRSLQPNHPLVAWRVKHKLTQEALIVRLGDVMDRLVSKSTLSRIETGKFGGRRPDLELLRAIVKVTRCQVTLDQLLPN